MRRGLFFLLTLLVPLGGWTQGKTSTVREMPFVPPKRWALVIGASDYAEMGKLKYAAEDAKLFSKTLIERFGYQPESIELITDEADSPEKPDANTIEKALDRQLADKRLEKGDLFIVYFSGHGVGTAKGDFLLPTDATKANFESVGLPVGEITKRFVAAGLKNVLIIADACRSGEKNDFGEELWELGKKANLAVMLGCQPGERSYEYGTLGHGIFTYELAKALKNRELCNSVSGAMWASKVAAAVAADVHTYTERDYGEHAQNPKAWADQTSDVMLGAFPSRVTPELAIDELKREAQGLDADKLAETLANYGANAFGKGDGISIEAFKAVDGLGKLDPVARYLLALELASSGRNSEATKQFETLAKAPDSEIWGPLAVLFNPSRLVTPEQRVAAAKAAWKMVPEEWVAIYVWSSLSLYGSAADTASFLDSVLAAKELRPRYRAFFEAHRLAAANDWRGALRKWDEADAIAGSEPDSQTILTMRFIALANSGQYDKVAAFLSEAAVKDPEHAALWHLKRAEYYKEKKLPDAMISELKAALAGKVTDEQLLWTMRIVGLRFLQIADLVANKADEMPFAWKAMLAKMWAVKLVQGQDAVASALTDAMHYSDDGFAVLFECYRLLAEQLDDALDMGATTKEKYSQLMLAYSQSMAENVDKLGFDSDAWILLDKFCLMSEKFEQLNALFEVKLGKYADSGTLDPNLRVCFLYAALSVGNEARAKRMMDLGGFHPGDAVDSKWVYAGYLATHGRAVEARALVAGQPPSIELPLYSKALNAYLDVRAGKSVDLAKTLATVRSYGGATQLIALAYVLKGDWAHAEPLLKESLFDRQLSLIYLQAKVVSTYFDRLQATGRFEEANDVAYKVSISGYGNPLYRTIHFGKSVRPASYAGHIEAEAAQFAGPDEIHSGHADWVIDASGLVKGTLEIEGKKETVAGSVDEYGNLAAQVLVDGKVWKLTGKLAPPSYYPELRKAPGAAQIFLLLDSEGQSQFVILKP